MQDMAKESKLNSKATYDNSFGIFREMLKYKLEDLDMLKHSNWSKENNRYNNISDMQCMWT